jgi:hypothetical protein
VAPNLRILDPVAYDPRICAGLRRSLVAVLRVKSCYAHTKYALFSSGVPQTDHDRFPGRAGSCTGRAGSCTGRAGSCTGRAGSCTGRAGSCTMLGSRACEQSTNVVEFKGPESVDGN